MQNYKTNKLLVLIKFYFNYLNIFDYILQFDIFVITGSSFFRINFTFLFSFVFSISSQLI